MDSQQLSSLDPSTAVLVPTRSLANTLNEQIAQYHIQQKRSVWQAPTIIVWSDYLRGLWQSNRAQLSATANAHNLISTQQSLLLWTQVIETSRREERELTLLNVQQTARAVQRSWRLMHDWRVATVQIQDDHVADTEQFLVWLDAYQTLMRKRSVIDEPGLIDCLCSQGALGLKFPYQTVVWYAYDLVTSAQHAINQFAEQAGITIEHYAMRPEQTQTSYCRYPDVKSELRATFESARAELEQNADVTINIIVPDLQRRYAQVRELAREVFYPAASPMQVQQNNTVYRFSLGQPLNEWAAIETALSVIKLLKGRCTVSDLSFVLRNRFLGLSSDFKVPCRGFDGWLKTQRMQYVVFDDLPELYAQYCEGLAKKSIEPEGLSGEFKLQLQALVGRRQGLQDQLSQAKLEHGFAAIGITDWPAIIADWLSGWRWQTRTVSGSLNSVHHQLELRWTALLEEFSALAAVQRQAGLARVIELIEQMARDAIFLPKAAASPIIISSVFEAIGRSVDRCFLTGMNQSFPPPPSPDAFIPNRLLLDSGYPDATAESSFQQANKVNQSLLACAKQAVVSYAQQNDQQSETQQHASALYRGHRFISVTTISDATGAMNAISSKQFNDRQASVPLTPYLDTQGSAWSDPGRARGGSKIFENQSNCAFKAFVTHQLSFDVPDEAEFGLDSLDRGNVVHHLLDLTWSELQTQANLLTKSDEQLAALIDQIISQTIADERLGLSLEKRALLELERGRLTRLLKNWLALEAKRPEGFAVVEREEQRYGEFAGIKFKYIVDRLDISDDGRSFIIDYKTGAADRKDWVGERIKRPQMPLYVLALDAIKQQPVSGIAYAKVNQTEPKFVELSEADVFRKRRRYETEWETQWHDNRASWEEVFTQLAQDFLAGQADVNPIDEETCRYCDLQSVCRVSQLRDNQAFGAGQDD